ncbi:MAG: hypothetical protein BGO10_09480 [Chlamydia sp. 32-24]|mgnify:CR=1 FL=1|nr:MAG: hypothetical protein BGO10_09480 [Chlamydia sp. 32-24]
MRFIVNFILFGILFYIIYLYFPEAFATLVSWVSQLFDFLRDVGTTIVNYFKGLSSSNPAEPTHETVKTLLQHTLNK